MTIEQVKEYMDNEKSVYFLEQEYDYWSGPTVLQVEEGIIRGFRYTSRDELQVLVNTVWIDAEDVYLDEATARESAVELA